MGPKNTAGIMGPKNLLKKNTIKGGPYVQGKRGRTGKALYSQFWRSLITTEGGGERTPPQANLRGKIDFVIL